MRTARTGLLTLGLLVLALFGCAGPLVLEDDTLTGYRLELAKLVKAGVLTKEDEESFMGLPASRRNGGLRCATNSAMDTRLPNSGVQ